MQQIIARLTVSSEGQILLFGIISVICGVSLLAYICYYLMLWRNSRHWVLVEAKVLFLLKTDDPYEHDFKKNISYEYSFDGKRFVSSSFQLGWHRQRPFKTAIYNQLSDVNFGVYVNSRNPRQSSANVDLDVGGVVFLLFLGALLLVPGVVFFHA